MKLTEVCIDKPVFAWMLMAATVVFGGVAASRIGISQFPDVDYPMISITLAWEGAPPEVMEHDVVYPVEEAMVQVEGVKDIHSESLQGAAWVGIELDLSRDVDVALLYDHFSPMVILILIMVLQRLLGGLGAEIAYSG